MRAEIATVGSLPKLECFVPLTPKSFGSPAIKLLALASSSWLLAFLQRPARSTAVYLWESSIPPTHRPRSALRPVHIAKRPAGPHHTVRSGGRVALRTRQ